MPMTSRKDITVSDEVTDAIKFLSSMPLEECLIFLDGDKSNDIYKMVVLERDDCSDDEFVDICRTLCNNNFIDSCIRNRLRRKHDNFEKIGRKLEDYVMEQNQASLMLLPTISDDAKRKLIDTFYISPRNNALPQFTNFVLFQWAVPEDRREHLRSLIEQYNIMENENGRSWICMEQARNALARPLSDSDVDDILSTSLFKYAESEKISRKIAGSLHMKMALNPSISDYAVMQLLVKGEPSILKQINAALDSTMVEREKYRLMDKKH